MENDYRRSRFRDEESQEFDSKYLFKFEISDIWMYIPYIQMERSSKHLDTQVLTSCERLRLQL